MKKEKEQPGKQFTAMNEDGKCYSFMMNNNATRDDAETYAKLWNSLAKEKTRIVKVWENIK